MNITIFIMQKTKVSTHLLFEGEICGKIKWTDKPREKGKYITLPECQSGSQAVRQSGSQAVRQSGRKV
ncbi:hypothetical protein TUM12370_01970 [Salmonella enterica subsp. enterica serovar Choleraesuis]|nr:hypothetical protein TUM12370_01970 [Salmonella enterica subsp. enterica serovar Choleraesuis]